MAFGGGAVAKTDWKEGSPIVWTDMENNVGANGIITTMDANKLLEFRYYDDIVPPPDGELGEYIERFVITPEPNNEIVLSIKAGPLSKKYINQHTAMWSDALKLIEQMKSPY
jgi:hypothetical protein